MGESRNFFPLKSTNSSPEVNSNKVLRRPVELAAVIGQVKTDRVLPSSAFVANAVPGAKLVKGFNHLVAATLATDPIVEGGHRVVFRRAAAKFRREPAMVDKLKGAFAGYFQKYDVLLCPVIPFAAPPPGLDGYIVNGEKVPATHMMRATVPFNLTGVSADWRRN
jgi:hypothetical protein